jgi:hypothetical protein
MAASIAAGGLRAIVISDTPILVRRPAIVPGESLFHEPFEDSCSTSLVSFDCAGAKKMTARPPHREHFLAQKIA